MRYFYKCCTVKRALSHFNPKVSTCYVPHYFAWDKIVILFTCLFSRHQTGFKKYTGYANTDADHVYDCLPAPQQMINVYISLAAFLCW